MTDNLDRPSVASANIGTPAPCDSLPNPALLCECCVDRGKSWKADITCIKCRGTGWQDKGIWAKAHPDETEYAMDLSMYLATYRRNGASDIAVRLAFHIERGPRKGYIPLVALLIDQVFPPNDGAPRPNPPRSYDQTPEMLAAEDAALYQAVHQQGELEGLRRAAQAVCDCCGGRRMNADAFEPAEYITTAALWQHRHKTSRCTLIECGASEIHRLIAAHQDTGGAGQ